MPVIKNLILDWSGTLVDDFPPVLKATNRIFEIYGKPVFTAEEFREKFFLPFPEFYALHLPEVTQTQLDSHYHEAFRLLQEEIPLLPFARDFLEYAQGRGLKMFLLSTIHAEHFKAQSARLGIGHFFTQAYTQALDKRQTIHRLLEEHGLDPQETLFIGDMAHDIDTARHGGVHSCAVLTGYDGLDKLRQANPDLLYQNLHQVRLYLEEHRQAELPPPIGTVGGLIYNRRGQVLMIQTYKWNHHWGIPGGKIKGNEPSLDALRREIREETALELEEIRFAMVQDCIASPEFYKKAHFLLLNYTALAVGDGEGVTLNEEADCFRWVMPEEALALPLNIPTRILLDYVRSHPDLAFVP